MAKAETIRIEKTGARILGGTIDIKQDALIESGNVRKSDGKDPSIKSLADNMRAVGQLVPIIVRPLADLEKYELIAGHRRLAASRLAGIEMLKAMVVVATDEQAQTIALTENLQRENLSPMQEAAAIKKLLDTGMDRKTAAAVLGWAESKVARRARLLELIPEWLDAIAGRLQPDILREVRKENRYAAPKTEHFARWSAAHLELIARYSPERQHRLLIELSQDYQIPNCSPQELAFHLANEMKLLKKAFWKLDDDSLVPEAGACTTCPKRSGANPGLFDDDLTPEKIAANDRCLDPNCWAGKVVAHTKRKEAELRAQYPDMVKIKEGWSGHEDCLGTESYEVVKKETPGAKPAIIAEGENAGQIKWIKLNDRGSKKKASRGKDASGKPKLAPLAERKQRLQDRRNAHAIVALRALLSNHEDPRNYPRFAAKAHTLTPIGAVACLIPVFGVKLDYDYKKPREWNLFDRLLKASSDEIVKELWKIVTPELETQIFFDTAHRASEKLPAAKRICDLLCLDFGEFEKAAEVAIPVPKSWGKEAGTKTKTEVSKQPKKAVPETKKAKTYQPPQVKVKRQVKRKSLVHAKGK